MVLALQHTSEPILLSPREKGASIIETVFVLPLLILFAFGILEFGWEFVKNEVTSLAVNRISLAIQEHASDSAYNNASDGLLRQMAYSSGAGIVKFSPEGPNYICAHSYATLADANAAAGTNSQGQLNVCEGHSVFAVAPPTPGSQYYVTLGAYVANPSFTVMGKSWIKPFIQTSVIPIVPPPVVGRQWYDFIVPTGYSGNGWATKSISQSGDTRQAETPYTNTTGGDIVVNVSVCGGSGDRRILTGKNCSAIAQPSTIATLSEANRSHGQDMYQMMVTVPPNGCYMVNNGSADICAWSELRTGP